MRYCGPVCQRAHWRTHKPDCVILGVELLESFNDDDARIVCDNRNGDAKSASSSGLPKPPPLNVVDARTACGAADCYVMSVICDKESRRLNMSLMPPLDWIPDHVKALEALTAPVARMLEELYGLAAAGALTVDHLRATSAMHPGMPPSVFASIACRHDGTTLLHVAAARDDESLATALLSMNPLAIGKWSLDSPTPLHVAAFTASRKVLPLLLAHKSADPNVVCVWAGSAGDAGILLIRDGKPPARVSPAARKSGLSNAAPAFWRPLHWAVLNPRDDDAAFAVQTLLARGADPNAPGGKHNVDLTPLSLAALFGKPKAFRALIAGGADPRLSYGFYRLDGVRAPFVLDRIPPPGTSSLDVMIRTFVYNIGGGPFGHLSHIAMCAQREATETCVAAIEAGCDPFRPPPTSHARSGDLVSLPWPALLLAQTKYPGIPIADAMIAAYRRKHGDAATAEGLTALAAFPRVTGPNGLR